MRVHLLFSLQSQPPPQSKTDSWMDADVRSSTQSSHCEEHLRSSHSHGCRPEAISQKDTVCDEFEITWFCVAANWLRAIRARMCYSMCSMLDIWLFFAFAIPNSWFFASESVRSAAGLRQHAAAQAAPKMDHSAPSLKDPDDCCKALMEYVITGDMICGSSAHGDSGQLATILIQESVFQNSIVF